MQSTDIPFEAAATESDLMQRVLRNIIGVWLILIVGWVMQMHALAEDSLPTKQKQLSATIAAFYHWYLGDLGGDRDPIRDDRAKMNIFVSKDLLEEIDKRIGSANGIDEDYFIEAQDYLDDWAKSVVVSVVSINLNSASAMVTLGSTKQSRHRLEVSLRSELGSWKIIKVSQPAGS